MATFDVGATLQRERLRQGLSLKDIAVQTRISQRFLTAIEAGDFASLPGIVFTRNFVRQFAASLGMDAAPLLAGLPSVDIDAIPLPSAEQFARSRPRNTRWAAAFSSMLWLALAIGASAGGYAYLNHPPKSTAQASAPKALPVPATPVPMSLATSLAPAAAKQPVQVVLKAREASWVEIIADGKNAFTGILNANDSREIAATALVKVTAGNAGGLEISLNGKSLDPLGPAGQVRTIRLTPEGPQTVMKSPQIASTPL